MLVLMTSIALCAGVIDLSSQFFADQIRNLRLQGGDVVVSFGGANGIELAQASSSMV